MMVCAFDGPNRHHIFLVPEEEQATGGIRSAHRAKQFDYLSGLPHEAPLKLGEDQLRLVHLTEQSHQRLLDGIKLQERESLSSGLQRPSAITLVVESMDRVHRLQMGYA